MMARENESEQVIETFVSGGRTYRMERVKQHYPDLKGVFNPSAALEVQLDVASHAIAFLLELSNDLTQLQPGGFEGAVALGLAILLNQVADKQREFTPIDSVRHIRTSSEAQGGMK